MTDVGGGGSYLVAVAHAEMLCEAVKQLGELFGDHRRPSPFEHHANFTFEAAVGAVDRVTGRHERAGERAVASVTEWAPAPPVRRWICAYSIGLVRRRRFRAEAECEIEILDADAWLLPPDSPDLNSIKRMFAKIKQKVRDLACRTKDALWQAIQPVLDTVTYLDALHCFQPCGYTLGMKSVGFSGMLEKKAVKLVLQAWLAEARNVCST